MACFLRLSASSSAPDEYAAPASDVYFNTGVFDKGVVTATASAAEIADNAMLNDSLRFYLEMLQAYPYRCAMTTQLFGRSQYVSVSTQRDTPSFSTTKGPNETFSVARFDMFSDDVRLYVPSIASYLRLEHSALMGRYVLKPRAGAATTASNVSVTCDVGSGAFLSRRRYSIATRSGYRLRVLSSGGLAQTSTNGVDTEFYVERMADNTCYIMQARRVLVIGDDGFVRMGQVTDLDAAPLRIEAAYDHYGRFLIIGPEPDNRVRFEPTRQLAFDEWSDDLNAPYYDTWEEPFHTFQIHPVD